jgi:uncharacterized membrane protein YhaH (DUF805 family)
MELARILFSDEGTISRRQWWLGAAILIGFQLLAGHVAAREFGQHGFDRPLMLFIAIALLIPLHSLNMKRFRAIGQPTWFALAGGAVAMASILAGAFLPGHPVNIPLGLALLAVILWFAAALGCYDPPPRIDATRNIDPAARRA